MKSRHLATKLCFGVAFLFALGGLIFIKRGLLPGLTLDPLYFVLIPGLIPFSIAILLACFGALYLGFELMSNRSVSLPLAAAQLIFFLLGSYGHSVMMKFWWRVLGAEGSTAIPVPMWSMLLSASAFSLSLIVFVFNLAWSMRNPFEKHQD
jgi:heme/copper-type cytochrome/quinol oxidase subunit 1